MASTIEAYTPQQGAPATSSYQQKSIFNPSTLTPGQDVLLRIVNTIMSAGIAFTTLKLWIKCTKLRSVTYILLSAVRTTWEESTHSQVGLPNPTIKREQTFAARL